MSEPSRLGSLPSGKRLPAPHDMYSTHKDQINADLLAFFKA
jgi:hypothetical protein